MLIFLVATGLTSWRVVEREYSIYYVVGGASSHFITHLMNTPGTAVRVELPCVSVEELSIVSLC